MGEKVSVKANFSSRPAPSILSAEASERNNSHHYLSFHGGLLSVCHVPCPLKESSMVTSFLINRGGRALHPSIHAELLGFKTIEGLFGVRNIRQKKKQNLGSSHTPCFKDRTTIVIITALALSPFLTAQHKSKYRIGFSRQSLNLLTTFSFGSPLFTLWKPPVPVTVNLWLQASVCV